MSLKSNITRLIMTAKEMNIELIGLVGDRDQAQEALEVSEARVKVLEARCKQYENALKPFAEAQVAAVKNDYDLKGAFTGYDFKGEFYGVDLSHWAKAAAIMAKGDDDAVE